MPEIDPLREEAKRLLSLTPAEGQEEIVLTALRIGEQDRQAGEALDQLDRDFLDTIFPVGTNHVEQTNGQT